MNPSWAHLGSRWLHFRTHLGPNAPISVESGRATIDARLGYTWFVSESRHNIKHNETMQYNARQHSTVQHIGITIAITMSIALVTTSRTNAASCCILPTIPYSTCNARYQTIQHIAMAQSSKARLCRHGTLQRATISLNNTIWRIGNSLAAFFGYSTMLRVRIPGIRRKILNMVHVTNSRNPAKKCYV